MDNQRAETENKIIEAAMKVFTKKGYKGATMRDIAAEAEINLAMLNYYFRSKDNLFDIIFERAFKQIYGKLFEVLANNSSIFDKIRGLVNEIIEILLNNPELASLIFAEVSINPERLSDKFKGNSEVEKIFNRFQKQIDKEVKLGIMKPISFMELYMNIDALCVFPFLAKPMFTGIFNLSEMNYGGLMERRKSTIADFIIAGLQA
ncbi:MAG: TetR/AcrR family transcriptional regulator [Calditrichaeota bacterium]|nr:MAG: TetR/AcrR family transcriptional regulator [Calditrichota bacterium]